MFRSIVAVAFFAVAIDCTTASAQRHGNCARGAHVSRGHYSGGHRHYRSDYPSSSFGLSIGIGGYPGYGYSSFGYRDPYPFYGYRSGYDPYGAPNFEAPDLLRDPYFRARHKFDSRFPGRYRAQLEFRPVVPAVAYPSHGDVVAYPDPDQVHAAPVHGPVGAGDPVGQLRAESETLAHSLATLPGGAPWREYLAPHRISQLIATGDLDQLRELLTRYDGVLGNPQLRSIEASHGFAATRILLRQFTSQPSESTEPPADPTVETLPLPAPIR